MEEFLHQLVDSLSHYLEGFIHPSWLIGISSINSTKKKKLKILSAVNYKFVAMGNPYLSLESTIKITGFII